MSQPPRIPETDIHSDEDLSALIDGELSPDGEQMLRARIAAEPELAARRAALERVDVALRALPVAQPSPDLQARLRERVTRDEAASGLRGKLHRLPVWGGAALAAAAAVTAYLMLTPAQEPLAPIPAQQLDPELAAASEEEIGIALDYETLADLDVIEELELLEQMAALEEATASGRKERG